MKASRKSVLALIGAMAMGAAVAAPSVEIVSVQQQYPWTNTVDIVYNVAGVASDTNGYFVAFTPTTQDGLPIEDINGETSIQVALSCTTNGAVAQWFPQTNQQYTACKMTPAVYRGGSAGGNDYMIVDLLTGAISYEPMATQEASNQRYNTQEYKTKKLVLRKIPVGEYWIGRDDYSRNTKHLVKATKEYYIGIFPLTVAQHQYCLGLDRNSTDTTPVIKVSWNTMRGSALPAARLVPNASSTKSPYIRLAGLTGLPFDLPTEEMWEIAARATTTTYYYWGDTFDGNYAWCSANSGNATKPVGQKLPNAWGLYDMVGNIWEWCRDAYSSEDLATKTTDIYTPQTQGSQRVLRSRGYYTGSGDVTPWVRDSNTTTIEHSADGFRLSVVVD